ncbi:hypothetical protein OWM54_17400 [Myxococcus sp. MISCRS1]|uniref:hypothetical protein n=1 Tax=Myxococcus TaxID=32 RepID=UPI0022717FD1|nr:hypothetical protein [Myxococcus sp. MISCRS1]MCY0998919.1 hypothetical protein [Myxococcus sp. MISCRS1]
MSLSVLPPPPTAPRAESAPRRVARHLVDTSARAGILSRPLLERFPLRRWVPSEVHTLLDYRAGVAAVVAGHLSEDGTARRAGWALGASLVGITLLTDARLSVSKLIPIEVHELFDYVHGAAAVLAPFALGYAKRHPLTAAAHVLLGLSSLAVALVTDYRCQTGMHLGGEHLTDPEGIGA